MASGDLSESEDLVCKSCRYPGSDLRLVGCGCTIHARCAPFSLVLDMQGQGQQERGIIPSPNTSKTTICPFCQSNAVSGVHLLPLDFKCLERAVDLRKSSTAIDDKKDGANQRKKRARDEDPQDVQPESSYLLMSNSQSSASDQEQRTGRWTDAEIAFVDYLVAAFDQGTLPLPHGIKLNEFLGKLLICKSSRLTKKMKNAKLSARSFSLCSPLSQADGNDVAILSSLQEKFLLSLTSEPMQMEMRFNLTKQWRTHFSNLCVQIGYPFLDGKEWVASLHELELRASNAAQLVRSVRRKRMEMSVKNDEELLAKSNTDLGLQQLPSGEVPMAQPVLSTTLAQVTSRNEDAGAQGQSNAQQASDNENKQDDEQLGMLELGDDDCQTSDDLSSQQIQPDMSPSLFPRRNRLRSISVDLDDVLKDWVDRDAAPAAFAPPSAPNDPPPRRLPTRSYGPFMEAILIYMESHHLPFHYADVWVPSFVPQGDGSGEDGNCEQLKLLHAGHATRPDIDDACAQALSAFGLYSESFSFEPWQGLPGRVYSSGGALWEHSVTDCDPKKFMRVEGAKMHGVKSVCAIPLSTRLVGRIVVALYSREYIQEDMNYALDCAKELTEYAPEPRWKLVIEVSKDPVRRTSNTGGDTQRLQRPEKRYADQQDRKLPASSGSAALPVDGIEAEERSIVTLLGEHMPVSDRSQNGASGNPRDLLSNFMAIRLLLLRPVSRRTPQENEMIAVLKNSFRGYSKDNGRGGAELANLLVKDWVCLSATFISPATSQDSKLKAPLSGNVRQGARPLQNPLVASTKSTMAPIQPPSNMVWKPSTMALNRRSAFGNTPVGAPSLLHILNNARKPSAASNNKS